METPMRAYTGMVPNPHIVHGQGEIDTSPITFARYATRWADVQLSNGWQNTNYGRRMTLTPMAYLMNAVPTIPGQTRLSGQATPSAFPIKGMAPSQWDFHVQNSAGQQPDNPGGPGQTLGPVGGFYGGGGA
jgi:hypothetical protein